MRKYPRVKLNHNKTEGIWFGRDNARPLIDMQHRNDVEMMMKRCQVYKSVIRTAMKKTTQVSKEREIEELQKCENKSNSYKLKL